MKWAFLLFTLLFSLFTYAQVPQSFNYQAVARDASGKVIVGQLAARFKLHEDHAAGTTRYAETHTVTTNDQGIFSLQVGGGTIVSGNMDLIDWAKHDYFLETQIKTSNDADYVSMGTTQLLSVPYAMYAAASGTSLTGGNGIEVQNEVINNTGDLSVTNELQSLSINGNQLHISDGNTVTLPTGTTYTEGAGIDINGNAISASDPSPTNEIQTLSLNGQQLSLSNGGGSVQLPAGNTSWATNGSIINNNPTSNDVAIGTTSNSNSKLNVVSSGAEHGGNFTAPTTGDALRAYCNGTGAGIRASSLNGPAAVFTSGAGNAGTFTSTSGIAGYFSSNGKALIVDDGNVGIGTNNPAYKMHVHGNFKVDGGDDDIIPSVIIKSHNSYTALDVTGDNTGDGARISAITGKALVLENYYFGMGTGLRISASQGHWDQYLDVNNNLNFAAMGVRRAWIYGSDGSYHNSSDMRLKKDIKPFSNVLAGVSKLQAYTYHMKDAPEDSPLSIGFMAQEVEQQFPQMVVEQDGYKSLCYDQFAVLSIQAVKEQQAQIDTLQQKVTELEALVMEMKSLIADKKQ